MHPAFPVAPLWRRAISRLVDLAALAALVAGALYLAHKLGLEYFPVNDAIVFGVIAAYEVLLPSFTGGSSLGRLISRTRLVRENGQSNPGVFQYVGRSVVRVGLFTIFAVFVAYEMGLPSFLFVCAIEGLFCLLRQQRQTLGDLAARTLVIQLSPRGTTAA